MIISSKPPESGLLQQQWIMTRSQITIQIALVSLLALTGFIMLLRY